MKSASRPIFITSTFTDMQAERDWLRQHVFPELDEWVRTKGMRLEPIDLRWGVQTRDAGDQQAKEMLVLKKIKGHPLFLKFALHFPLM